MIYNMDFLISAMVILLLILWHFLGQKRAEDLNNRVFLFFAVLGTADVVAEFFTNYYITSYNSDMENAAVIVTTIFYLLQNMNSLTPIFRLHIFVFITKNHHQNLPIHLCIINNHDFRFCLHGFCLFSSVYLPIMCFIIRFLIRSNLF